MTSARTTEGRGEMEWSAKRALVRQVRALRTAPDLDICRTLHLEFYGARGMARLLGGITPEESVRLGKIMLKAMHARRSEIWDGRAPFKREPQQ